MIYKIKKIKEKNQYVINESVIIELTQDQQMNPILNVRYDNTILTNNEALELSNKLLTQYNCYEEE